MGLEILKSKLAVTVALVLLAIAGFYLARESYRKAQVNQEIRDLQNQISMVEGKNKEISDLIKYYKSQTYKERQARTLLNLQKPGEFAVALPQSPEDQNPANQPESNGSATNLKLWWDYFFGK
ncbi:MAG: hypothetical protein A2754_02260 [Candidatus Magasanikbacteria bacterium RIFCSPHIGHO2_01_FULL_47_8]|uniref:Septum formation initiator n=1 Tax=Candidatus Magasanikbacteria bacterium RIFCSPHIGHO2_01_FULL_47_8 TaxID=1798673 RepID=A0A1F6MAQ2_9BACT|nr:MAG: hypothetical protein A2754_02260 [Candidatus Magasanikbacteria bacterium RIFCSPHIGHO2_01_FULL_47_8]